MIASLVLLSSYISNHSINSKQLLISTTISQSFSLWNALKLLDQPDLYPGLPCDSGSFWLRFTAPNSFTAILKSHCCINFQYFSAAVLPLATNQSSLQISSLAS